ncbi:polysaccharide pyruvyl transferase family protein [bacterium]|nr:polysaccharide pyruvyl transferase family protein [bacterium]
MSRVENRILLINEGLSDNFGDQVIKESMSYLINRNGCEIEFQDLTRHKALYHNRYCDIDIDIDVDVDVDGDGLAVEAAWVLRLKGFLWKLLWIAKNTKRIVRAAFNQYDAVVIGGGQLLLSNGIFPLALFVWVSLLKVRNKKNIALFSVGLQGSYGKFERIIFSYVLDNVSCIYVRDDLSKETLQRVFNKHSIVTYDSAFVYNNVYQVKKTASKYLHLIGVVDYRVYCLYANSRPLSRHDYFKTWVALIGEGVDFSKTALIYATVEDRSECLNFKNFLKDYYDVDIDVLENVNHYQFLDNLALGDTVVSGRMHSLILALVSHKRILPYVISEKIEFFLETLERESDLERIQTMVYSDFEKMISQVSQ